MNDEQKKQCLKCGGELAEYWEHYDGGYGSVQDGYECPVCRAHYHDFELAAKFCPFCNEPLWVVDGMPDSWHCHNGDCEAGFITNDK
jgi:hypothetical protein